MQSFCELSQYLALVDLHQDFFLEKRFMQSFFEFYYGILLLLIGTRVAFFSWRRDLCKVVCRVSCKRGQPAAHVLFHFWFIKPPSDMELCKHPVFVFLLYADITYLHFRIWYYVERRIFAISQYRDVSGSAP